MPKEGLIGRYVTLVNLDLSLHGQDLFEEFFEQVPKEERDKIWTYVDLSPCHDRTSFNEELSKLVKKPNTAFYAVLTKSRGKFKAVGIAGSMRID